MKTLDNIEERIKSLKIIRVGGIIPPHEVKNWGMFYTDKEIEKKLKRLLLSKEMKAFYNQIRQEAIQECLDCAPKEKIPKDFGKHDPVMGFYRKGKTTRTSENVYAECSFYNNALQDYQQNIKNKRDKNKLNKE